MPSQAELKMANPKRSSPYIKSKLHQKNKTKEHLAPHQIIDKARYQLDIQAGVIQRVWHLLIYIHFLTTGLLERRNQCAHTETIPGMITLIIHHIK